MAGRRSDVRSSYVVLESCPAPLFESDWKHKRIEKELANARHKSEVRRAAVSTRYQRTNEATNEPTNVGSASSTNVEAISGAKTNPIIIKGGGDITAPV